MPHEHRRVRSLGIARAGEPYLFGYDEAPAQDGQLRLELLYTGLSAGTELTFLKGTNPYLHSRWDEGLGVFLPGEPSTHYPVNFLGYMEVARVIDARAPGHAKGDVLAASFGHKTGHVADPAHDLLVPLPPEIDPMLGIFVAQMGPIAANGILHAGADQFGAALPNLGAAVEGRPVLVWGGGTVGLFCAMFARAGGASHVVVVDPSPFRRRIAQAMGFDAMEEDQAVRHAKSAWHHKVGGRGAEYVFQTRAHSDSLNRCLQALRPQGTVIDLAFYQGGMNDTRLGEEFHHNGLAIRCAQINRMPRQLAHAWDQRRLALETLRLLQTEGDLIRQHMITHVIGLDDAPEFLLRLVAERPDFLQIVFEAP
ncbi:zinc-binding alcohol dehydrogenase [Paracoccus sp. CPCC 101403]|uniref:Zinc-binding alcohol dehydrogenase n=1 Tax=Paracoccus broussonetiae TaxID=3075834 RepID=A0ABU3EK48_9RHOB|nr:zinc-binding alcohol dehydrogenase [Paracoccus sp. CPCC 101403]MDT1064619.1 zinc-binding alcohol dehydrogenase [Paracoccus sp. CPCC 101403]